MKSNKKTILLYPAGLAQKEAFVEARRQNLHIVSIDGDHNAPLQYLADEFFAVNPANISELMNFVEKYQKKHKLNGVLIVGCDLPLSCAKIAKYIQTPGISETAAKLTVDKIAMKQVMQNCDVCIPDYYPITSAVQLASIVESVNQKMIVKPNDNCGSRGILQVSPGDDYELVYQYARKNTKLDKKVILEKFIPGIQISIEALILSGDIYVTGFADRNYEFLDKYAPHIIENGATMPTELSHNQQHKIITMFEKGIRALGLNQCVAKGDMVLGPDGAVVIEIAGRISGGKFASKLVPESNGVNLLQAAIQCAIGEPIDQTCLKPKFQRGVAVRYIFPKPGVITEIEGFETVKKLEGVIELVINKQVGDTVGKIQCHADRAGWVVTSASSRSLAVKIAEEAILSINIKTKHKIM